jgi:hypothetical protein
VYELFGESELTQQEFSRHLNVFGEFLDLCVQDPSSALEVLSRQGLDAPTRTAIVTKYAKEVQRMHIDIRHDYEQRLSTIRQRMESELPDQALSDQVTNSIGSGSVLREK